jgi:hypothetical protein
MTSRAGRGAWRIDFSLFCAIFKAGNLMLAVLALAAALLLSYHPAAAQESTEAELSALERVIQTGALDEKDRVEMEVLYRKWGKVKGALLRKLLDGGELNTRERMEFKKNADDWVFSEKDIETNRKEANRRAALENGEGPRPDEGQRPAGRSSRKEAAPLAGTTAQGVHADVIFLAAGLGVLGMLIGFFVRRRVRR